MKKITVYLVMSFLFLSGFVLAKNNKELHYDDVLEGDYLCGEYIEGKNPCYYVSKILFSVNGYLEGNIELIKYLREELNLSLSSRQDFFNKNKISYKVMPSDRIGMAGSSPKDKKSIVISFIVEFNQKDIATITFASFSKSSFYISSGACLMNESANSCLKDYMNKFLEENVFKSLSKYR